MTRKVYVNVTARLILSLEEGVQVQEVLDQMDYNFSSTTDNADIIDTEITNYEIADSK
jgi:hypothetical protein